MIKSAVTVKRTVGKPLNDSLKKLKRSYIIVGIPRGGKGDSRKDGGPPNSELGWIHEKGSPAAGIPPRPFLEPGVENAKDQVTELMGQAIEHALEGKASLMKAKLTQAAQDAESAVKKYINDPSNFLPIKPETIKNRSRSRGTKTKRKGETEGTAKTSPLINSGSLWRAITAEVHED